jgi:hypothetical protein
VLITPKKRITHILNITHKEPVNVLLPKELTNCPICWLCTIDI